MDEQILQKKQKNIEDLKVIESYEYQRKQSDNLSREMYTENYVLDSKNTQLESARESVFENVYSESLVKMKSGAERIDDKEKKDYIKSQNKQRKKLQKEMEASGITLSSEQEDVLIEYRQLMENCRVFDNEVRETVKTVLKKNPNLMPNIEDEQEKTRLLSELVTAFLPEREFHINPPLDRQVKKVKAYLSDFKKDPIGSILRMQDEQTDSRTHKDLINAQNGGASFRMLYCEMKKRETLANVFPYVAQGTDQFALKNRDVQDLGSTVPMYKNMLENILKYNGIEAEIGDNLEYNSHYADVSDKKLKSSTKKDLKKLNRTNAFNLMNSVRIVEHPELEKKKFGHDYVESFSRIRDIERGRNVAKKRALNMKILSSYGAYEERKLYDKNLRSQVAYTQKVKPGLFANETDSVNVPLTDGKIKAKVKSEAHYIETYLFTRLKQAISEADYTKYRLDALKTCHPGEDVSKAFIEKNLAKEEIKLKALERRAADLQLFLDKMRTDLSDEKGNPGFLRKIRLGIVWTSDERRMKLLYDSELKDYARDAQENEALTTYKTVLEERIAKNEASLPKLPDPVYKKQDGFTVLDKENPLNFTVPEENIKATNRMINATRNDRLWLKKLEIYNEKLAEKKEEWDDQKKKIRERNLFYGRKNLGSESFDEIGKKRALMEEVSKNRHLISERTRAEEKKIVDEDLYGEANRRWRSLNRKEKEKFYMAHTGAYSQFTIEGRKADLPQLTNREKQILMYRYHRNEFDEWAKYVKYHKVPIEITEEDKKNISSLVEKIVAENQHHFSNVHYEPNPGKIEDDKYVFPKSVQQELRAMHVEYEGTWDTSNGFATDHDNMLAHKGRMGMMVGEGFDTMKAQLDKAKADEHEELVFAQMVKDLAPRLKEEIDGAYRSFATIVSGFGKYKNKKGTPVADPGQIKSLNTLRDSVVSEYDSYGKYMLPETKKLYEDLGETLGTGIHENLDEYEKVTAETVSGIKSDMKSLKTLLNSTPCQTTEDLVASIENKLKEISFGETTLELTEELKDREKWIKETMEKVSAIKKDLEDERASGRVLALEEIRRLSGTLSVPMTPGEAKIMTAEQHKLRKVSDIAILCQDYLANYSETKKTFGQKSDREYVEKVLKDLGKENMASIEKVIFGNEYKDAQKDLMGICQQTNLYKVYGVDGFERMRKNLTITDKFENMKPLYRYFLKYARGYVALAESLKTKKNEKDLSDKIRSAHAMVKYLCDSVFSGMYTGLETEETENSVFMPAAVEYYEKNIKPIEDEKERQKAEEEHKKSLEKANEAVEKLLLDMQQEKEKEDAAETKDEEDQEILGDDREEYQYHLQDQFDRIRDIASTVRSVEDVSEADEYLDMIREATDRMEALKSGLAEKGWPDIFEIETENEEVLSFREDVAFINDTKKLLEEKLAQKQIETMKNTINKFGGHKGLLSVGKKFVKVATGEKDLAKLLRSAATFDKTNLVLTNLRNDNPDYVKDTELKNQVDMETAYMQYAGTLIKGKILANQSRTVTAYINGLTKSAAGADDITGIDLQKVKKGMLALKKIRSTASSWLSEIRQAGVLTDDIEMLEEGDDPTEYLKARETIKSLAENDAYKITFELKDAVTKLLERDISKMSAQVNEIITECNTAKSVDEKTACVKKLIDISERADGVKNIIDDINIEGLNIYLHTADYSEEMEKEEVFSYNAITQKIDSYVAKVEAEVAADNEAFAPIESQLKSMRSVYEALLEMAKAEDFDFTTDKNKSQFTSLKKAYDNILESEEFKNYLEHPKASQVRLDEIREMGRTIDDMNLRFMRVYKSRKMQAINDKIAPIKLQMGEIIAKKTTLSPEDLKAIEGMKTSMTEIMTSKDLKELVDSDYEPAKVISGVVKGIEEGLEMRLKADDYVNKLSETTNQWGSKVAELLESNMTKEGSISVKDITAMDKLLAEGDKIKEREEYKELLVLGMDTVKTLVETNEKTLIKMSRDAKYNYIRGTITKAREGVASYLGNPKSVGFMAKISLNGVLKTIQKQRTSAYYTTLSTDDGKLYTKLENDYIAPLEKAVKECLGIAA